MYTNTPQWSTARESQLSNRGQVEELTGSYSLLFAPKLDLSPVFGCCALMHTKIRISGSALYKQAASLDLTVRFSFHHVRPAVYSVMWFFCWGLLPIPISLSATGKRAVPAAHDVGYPLIISEKTQLRRKTLRTWYTGY